MSEPKLPDKEIELAKFNFVGEEYRQNYHTRVQFYVTAYVALLATELTTYYSVYLSGHLALGLEIFAPSVVVATIYFVPQINGAYRKHKERVAELSKLMGKVENGEPIGDLETLMESKDTKKGKRKTYPELVKEDTRIKDADLGLLFTSEMDHYGSFWLFLVGLSIGILETLLILVVTVGTVGTANGVTLVAFLSYISIASLGGFTALTVGFWLILPKFGKDPSTIRAKRFKEYLDAKDEITKRDSKSTSSSA